LVVEQLRTSHPILAELSAQGKLKVIGAVYDLDSGIVSVLP
jgi:carbonic anhydrase